MTDNEIGELDFTTPVEVKTEPAKRVRAVRKAAQRAVTAVVEEKKEVAPIEQVATPQSEMVAFLERAVKDPSIDVSKLKALIEIQVDIEDRRKEAEFQTAMVAISNAIPQVGKNGRVDLKDKGSYSFARWPDMDRVLRPLMAEHGIRLSFTTHQREGGGGIVIATATHNNGKSTSAEVPLPLDAGPGRNNLQAMGSTISYGKRYGAEMLFNIVRVDAPEEDDGMSFGADAISHEQFSELLSMMPDAGTTEENFADYLQIPDLGSLHHSMFNGARSMLAKRADSRRRKALQS